MDWDIVSVLGNFFLLYTPSCCALVIEISVERFATKHSCYFAVLMIMGSSGYVLGFVRLCTVLEYTGSSRVCQYS